MSIVYRRMRAADVPAVHRIEELTFPQPWTEADFTYEVSQNPCARYMVVEKDGHVAGYAGARIVMEEGDITNVAIHPALRGMGLGKGVVAALLQYAANLGVQALTLEVRRGNLAAQHVYESLGFERFGVRKGYYTDNGEDAYLMVCTRMPAPDPNFLEHP